MSFKNWLISELLRFSGNRHLGREKEKYIRCFEKIYISKKQAELNELRANCAGKIITFRYFAFFLELTFLLLLFIHFISFLCTTFSGSHVRTGSYAPAKLGDL